MSSAQDSWRNLHLRPSSKFPWHHLGLMILQNQMSWGHSSEIRDFCLIEWPGEISTSGKFWTILLSHFISIINRVENFLGFEFLVRNEEIDGHSHKERGIFEESFSPIFTFIFSYICYQKGAKLFPKKPPYFWNTIFDPNTIFIAFLSINIFIILRDVKFCYFFLLKLNFSLKKSLF